MLKSELQPMPLLMNLHVHTEVFNHATLQSAFAMGAESYLNLWGALLALAAM